jgi:hypothetical protein
MIEILDLLKPPVDFESVPVGLAPKPPKEADPRMKKDSNKSRLLSITTKSARAGSSKSLRWIRFVIWRKHHTNRVPEPHILYIDSN